MRNGIQLLGTALLAVCVGAGVTFADHHEGGKEGGKKHEHGKRHKMHFEKRDSDGNGEISKAEWLAGAEARFGNMDADSDGAVTSEEWKAGHEAMRKRWKEHHEGGH